MGEPGITVSFKAFNIFKIEHAGREAESALFFCLYHVLHFIFPLMTSATFPTLD